MRERPAVRFIADGDEPAEVVIDLLATDGHAQAIHRLIESARIDHVPVESLVLTGSPRSSGENPHHIRQLLEAAGSLPPIVVHRPTMRVVDGFHRVQVARQLSMTEIAAHLFDADDESAFLLGVTLNVGHGLPLARADRKNAADHLLHEHPEWSNRMIGAMVGLSDKTIAVRRSKLTAEIPQLTRRIGRDSRFRPSTPRQRTPGQHQPPITEHPHKVDHPAHPTEQRQQEHGGRPASKKLHGERIKTGSQESSRKPRVASRAKPPPTDSMIERLKGDPSIRQTEAGRTVLRVLTMPVGTASIDQRLADKLPTHSLDIVASLAERRAADLLAFANHLRRRTTQTNTAES